jgi:hypothetical protein
MSQVDTHGTTLIDIVSSDAFAAGWFEVVRGDRLNVDRVDDDQQWSYERGRLAAVAARAKTGRIPPLWIDAGGEQQINPKVMDLVGAAFLEKALL